MEYRQLGKSGLKVPELCFGAGTFGAANEFFKAWSETTQEEANRIVDICMDAGMNLLIPRISIRTVRAKRRWARRWQSTTARV